MEQKDQNPYGICCTPTVSSETHQGLMGADKTDRIPPLTILRLFYFTRASYLPDQTYNSFNTSIVSQLTMNLSVIVACIPFSKPVADDVQSGILDNFRTNTMAHSSLNNDSTGHILQALPRTRRRPGDGFLLIADSQKTDHVVATGERTDKSLDKLAIRQKTGFAVHTEDKRYGANTDLASA